MDTLKWQNNPALQNLYKAEVSVLKNGLGGDFTLIGEITEDPDGRITAIGHLAVIGDQKQLIQIIFPTKYPYIQPVVIPLIENLDGSTGPQPKMFMKGNQYGTGAMCLMRKDQWNKNEHNIGWVLQRSKKWLLAAFSEAGFKKEDIVEELPAVAGHQGQVLIPRDVSLPAYLHSGIIILTRFKPNHYILEQNFLPENPFSLEQGKEAFRWFRMSSGLTFKELYSYGDVNKMLQKLQAFGIGIDHIVGKNLALYIPNDPNPWHFFKFPVNQNQIQVVYLMSRNIENELYHRTKEVFDNVILGKKRVTMIGLGAIGSEVARSLARNGVGHFNLFDNDTFEIGNSVRHAADLFFIGENKTSVAKQLILRSNPNISVNAYPVDILDDLGMLEASLSQSDLCIILTAEDSVDYLINDMYISRYSIPFVFARASAGGLSGSIQVVQQSRTACLKCLALRGADILPTPLDGKRYEELPPEYGSCSSPALPGSEIDTKEIALQVSRLSLQLLLEGEGSSYAPRLGDQFLWHGPFGSDKGAPFSWQAMKLEKHPDCGICN